MKMAKDTILAHDFIKFVMDNYGIQLIMKESDKDVFKELFPDIVEALEEVND